MLHLFTALNVQWQCNPLGAIYDNPMTTYLLIYLSLPYIYKQSLRLPRFKHGSRPAKVGKKASQTAMKPQPRRKSTQKPSRGTHPNTNALSPTCVERSKVNERDPRRNIRTCGRMELFVHFSVSELRTTPPVSSKSGITWCHVVVVQKVVGDRHTEHTRNG